MIIILYVHASSGPFVGKKIDLFFYPCIHVCTCSIANSLIYMYVMYVSAWLILLISYIIKSLVLVYSHCHSEKKQ